MLSKIIGFCFVDIARSLPTGFIEMLLYRATGPPRGHPVCGFGLGVKENLGASQALVPQHTLLDNFFYIYHSTLSSNFFLEVPQHTLTQIFLTDFFWRRLTRLNNALNLDSC